MKVITNPEITQYARVGETVYEGFNEGEVLFVRVCLDCHQGRVYPGSVATSAGVCKICTGTGYNIRLVRPECLSQSKG